MKLQNAAVDVVTLRRTFSKSRNLTIVTGCFALLYLFFSITSSSGSYNRSSLRKGSLFQRSAIPNIVHYTQLVAHPDDDLTFGFKQFLSLYATVVRIRPDIIYIHTDASDAAIQRAKDPKDPRNNNKWNVRILSIPQVRLRQVRAQTVATGNGKLIKLIQHKSDFVRMDAMYDIGGIYLDWDVIPLRDVKPLREAGFANVVGREHLGKVNNGCFMSQPGTAMIDIFRSEANNVFDGKWTTHSCILLTDVSERLVRTPGEVLIMEQLAFAPHSWTKADNAKLYSEHNETEISADYETDMEVENAYERWDRRHMVAEWEADWSASYFLHAFDRHGAADKTEEAGRISLRHILNLKNNFALLTYPVVKKAMDAGLLNESDADE